MTGSKIFLYLLLVFIMVGKESYSGESSTYNFSWLDPDKEVYVLQNRKFRKKRSLFLNTGFGKSLSGAFVDSTQIQVRVGFFFKEEYGVGVLYSKNSGKSNETSESAKGVYLVPFRRITQDYRGLMFLWAPFYSKSNFFNKVFYYDFIIGLGYGKLNEINNRPLVVKRDPSLHEVTGSQSGPLVDLELKFFITRHLSASLNADAMYYRAQNSKEPSKKVWYNHWDLTLSIGLTL